MGASAVLAGSGGSPQKKSGTQGSTEAKRETLTEKRRRPSCGEQPAARVLSCACVFALWRGLWENRLPPQRACVIVPGKSRTKE